MTITQMYRISSQTLPLTMYKRHPDSCNSQKYVQLLCAFALYFAVSTDHAACCNDRGHAQCRGVWPPQVLVSCSKAPSRTSSSIATTLQCKAAQSTFILWCVWCICCWRHRWHHQRHIPHTATYTRRCTMLAQRLHMPGGKDDHAIQSGGTSSGHKAQYSVTTECSSAKPMCTQRCVSYLFEC
jgi:hypothetical protein